MAIVDVLLPTCDRLEFADHDPVGPCRAVGRTSIS